VSAKGPRGPVTLGIDFSGSATQWQPRAAASAVWIARLAGTKLPSLLDLRRVQDLPGSAPPFERLAALLRAGDYAVAGIDAPFAPPAGYFAGTRDELLRAVQSLPRHGRPFPAGAQLLGLLAPDLAPRGRHVHRATEQVWRKRRINVRSVLWNGPRGGAAFAAACFTLLAECGVPAWPWTRGVAPLLAETFPAAQLRSWDLPWFGYNGADKSAKRQRRSIVAALTERTALALTPEQRRIVIASADALDSVLCALAARALVNETLAVAPTTAAADEGWIAVQR
jgi:hypothetical protein